MSSSKRKPRLSISKQRYKDKSAVPILNSTHQNIPCSPSPSPIRMSAENCSTPVTSKKRCYFLEESPSQDYDVPLSQQIPIPLSQDTLNLQCAVDVGWKWQSPKASGDYIMNVARSKPSRAPERRKEPGKAEIKGFFKFQEELQKLSYEEPSAPEQIIFEASDEHNKPEREIDLEQILASLDEGLATEMTKSNICDTLLSESVDEPNETTIVPLPIKVDSNNDSDKENKFIAELLDDSDFALLKCSQEIDKLVMEHQKIATSVANSQLFSPTQPISYLPAHLKQNAPSNEPFDDSFDDFLSTVPLDDIISSQDSIRHNLINKQPSNTSLTRHKSMPLENKRRSYQIGFTVSKRISCKEKLLETPNFEEFGSNSSVLSKTSSSSSSSSISGTSSFKKCSNYEIEKKRLEALQKLEARRRGGIIAKK